MLRAALERGSQALRLLTRGLFASVPSLRMDGSADGNQHYVTLFPVRSSGMVITGLVQRSYLMTAGFGIFNSAQIENADYFVSLEHNNGALLSRLKLAAQGDDFNPDLTGAYAQYENTLVPTKLIALPTTLRASAPGLVLNGIANDPYLINQPYWAALYIYNASGAIAGGNRYDCYFANVCVCSSNALLLRNLPLGSSLRYTLNALAPVTVNVDSQSRVSIDLADLIFPVKIKCELFTGLAGAGRRWAQQTMNVYGGDVYRGRAVDPPPGAVASPPLSRVGWILSASGTAFSSLSDAVDGNASSSWTPGVTGVGQWFAIQLTGLTSIGACKITASTVYPNSMPRSGTIETSTDGVTWTLRGSWIQAMISGGFVTVQWAPVVARYVRVTPTDVCVNSGDAWLIGEINLYATFP